MLYTVIESPRPDRFTSMVSGLLDDGWSLHGSPFVASTGQMCQALIKEEKKNAKPKAKVQEQTGS
jgi:hypothetical protein